MTHNTPKNTSIINGLVNDQGRCITQMLYGPALIRTNMQHSRSLLTFSACGLIGIVETLPLAVIK